MNRGIFAWIGVVLLQLDAILHLYRASLPNTAFFSSPLHQQYMLYVIVAEVLVVGLLTAPRWLGSRTWMGNVVAICWELGALGVWLIVYHAPEPAGLIFALAPVAKSLEVLVIVFLLLDLRTVASPRRSLNAAT